MNSLTASQRRISGTSTILLAIEIFWFHPSSFLSNHRDPNSLIIQTSREDKSKRHDKEYIANPRNTLVVSPQDQYPRKALDEVSWP